MVLREGDFAGGGAGAGEVVLVDGALDGDGSDVVLGLDVGAGEDEVDFGDGDVGALLGLLDILLLIKYARKGPEEA